MCDQDDRKYHLPKKPWQVKCEHIHGASPHFTTLILLPNSNYTISIICYSDNPADVRKFTFDRSYWSHDGFELTDTGYAKASTPDYIDQVIWDLGPVQWYNTPSQEQVHSRIWSRSKILLLDLINVAELIPYIFTFKAHYISIIQWIALCCYQN